MKVMSIGVNATQNFNGLWGKENSQCISRSYYDYAQMCEMGTNHFVTTKTYYPFKNETIEEINDVVKKNAVTETYKYNDENDISEAISEFKVNVMPKLDITEGQYNKYRNDDLLSKEENWVEDKLKLAGLKEYLIRNIKRN